MVPRQSFQIRDEHTGELDVHIDVCFFRFAWLCSDTVTCCKSCDVET